MAKDVLKDVRDPSLPLTVENTEERDDGYRTVLHGWGRVPANDKHYVDRVLFEAGVARNVPSEEAEEMARSKKIRVYVLPSEATDGDFVRATGIQPMPVRKFAAMLSAYDPAAIRAALGEDKLAELIKALSSK